MAKYKDSLGNVYDKLPANKPNPGPKGTKAAFVGRKGRNKAKCERYRQNRGKPNGPGNGGNKSGKNKGKK
jgi:hypothetical protein